jgi:hypothetical protein
MLAEPLEEDVPSERDADRRERDARLGGRDRPEEVVQSDVSPEW